MRKLLLAMTFVSLTVVPAAPAATGHADDPAAGVPELVPTSSLGPERASTPPQLKAIAG